MRKHKNHLLSLAFVAAFCGYLLSDSSTYEATGGAQKASAMLLSTPRPLEMTIEATSGWGDILPDETADDGESVLPMPPPPPQGFAENGEAPVLHVPNGKAGYRTAWALVTAYCPCWRCCGSHANGRTSTGTSAWGKGAAADPRAVSYGTRIYVPGFGYTVVDDTGGAMRRVWRRNGMIQIDLRMRYHWSARQWGRRTLKIRVYDLEH